MRGSEHVRQSLYWALLAALLGACSAGGDDGAGSGGTGGALAAGGAAGGAASGAGGANAGSGGGLAGTGGVGSVPTGSGGVGGMGGTSAGGSGGTGGSGGSGGAGGVVSMPMDAGTDTTDAGTIDVPGVGGRGTDPPFPTVYRIALRVHRGDSALTDDELIAVLDEMNWIWWSQAAICFEVEVVADEQTMQTGFDFWFHQDEIGCSPGANGVYCGDHDIHTLDRPNLGPTDDPVWDTVHDPSRTSAHELGHGLTLEHFNDQPDSNDSLMSSGRQGWKLHDFEIEAARTRAEQKKLDDTGALYCDAPVFRP